MTKAKRKIEEEVKQAREDPPKSEEKPSHKKEDLPPPVAQEEVSSSSVLAKFMKADRKVRAKNKVEIVWDLRGILDYV